jgi:hypothetical protein
MPSTETTEFHPLLRHQVLGTQEPAERAILVLTTQVGDYHFLVTRSDLQALSQSLGKHAEAMEPKS